MARIAPEHLTRDCVPIRQRPEPVTELALNRQASARAKQELTCGIDDQGALRTDRLEAVVEEGGDAVPGGKRLVNCRDESGSGVDQLSRTEGGLAYPSLDNQSEEDSRSVTKNPRRAMVRQSLPCVQDRVAGRTRTPRHR